MLEFTSENWFGNPTICLYHGATPHTLAWILTFNQMWTKIGVARAMPVGTEMHWHSCGRKFTQHLLASHWLKILVVHYQSVQSNRKKTTSISNTGNKCSMTILYPSPIVMKILTKTDDQWREDYLNSFIRNSHFECIRMLQGGAQHWIYVM